MNIVHRINLIMLIIQDIDMSIEVKAYTTDYDENGLYVEPIHSIDELTPENTEYEHDQYDDLDYDC